ncbi:MAG: purine-nucleoside phosphorylase [Gemmataceae bacterium]
MPADSLAALRDTVRNRPPVAALVLGSGLNEVTDGLPLLHAVPFGELPGMPAATVLGHRGRLCLHEIAGRTLLAFQGRLHFYEGHAWDVVERPTRLAAELGARVLLLTNASGGIGALQRAGSLMAIRDHIAANHPHWHRNLDRDRPSPYSRRLLSLLSVAAADVGQELPSGVYACVTGPNYETPAEIHALQTIGADAVGMSTVHEANTAASLGLEVAGISCIANLAAGRSPTPLSHAEVLAMVNAAAAKMSRLVGAFVKRLGDQ